MTTVLSILFGFRSESKTPTLVQLCQESLAVVEKHHSRTFGEAGAYPEVWFNLDIDTLYVDWGWDHGHRYEYGPQTLGNFIRRVKNPAVYHDVGGFLDRDYIHYEDFLRDLISGFSSLETLTLVNRRHRLSDKRDRSSAQDSENLTFMDNVDLLVWQNYAGRYYQCDTAPLDLARLNIIMSKFLETGERRKTKTFQNLSILLALCTNSNSLNWSMKICFYKRDKCPAFSPSIPISHPHLRGLILPVRLPPKLEHLARSTGRNVLASRAGLATGDTDT